MPFARDWYSLLAEFMRNTHESDQFRALQNRENVVTPIFLMLNVAHDSAQCLGSTQLFQCSIGSGQRSLGLPFKDTLG
jgi:hypothetical protein